MEQNEKLKEISTGYQNYLKKVEKRDKIRKIFIPVFILSNAAGGGILGYGISSESPNLLIAGSSIVLISGVLYITGNLLDWF